MLGGPSPPKMKKCAIFLHIIKPGLNFVKLIIWTNNVFWGVKNTQKRPRQFLAVLHLEHATGDDGKMMWDVRTREGNGVGRKKVSDFSKKRTWWIWGRKRSKMCSTWEGFAFATHFGLWKAKNRNLSFASFLLVHSSGPVQAKQVDMIPPESLGWGGGFNQWIT